MKTIGIFEAKTQFPRLCSEVEANRAPILVKRRGRPVVMITPVPLEYGRERPDILSAWQEWKREHGDREPSGDFPEVWKRRTSRSSNPLEEQTGE